MTIKPIYIFLFFLLFYLLTFCMGGYESYFYYVDGKVEYDQMKDIVKGDFSLLVSPRKHLGLSLAQIPFFLTGELLELVFHIKLNPPFTLLINPAITALTCLLLFLIVCALSTETTALIITMLYGFATMAWPYSKFDTTDPLLALCVLAVFWTLLKFNHTGQKKWFITSLVFMSATYITKLSGHGFVFGWLFYLYFIEKKRKASVARIAFEFFLIIMLWFAFIPLSINVSKVHPYLWSWFKEFGYKILAREFSPLDGLFWYCPLLLILFFSVGQFVRRFKDELIFIVALTVPYLLSLHFQKEFLCMHDFGGRYDIVYIPLLLIMLIPFIERFPAYSRMLRISFFLLVSFALYVQILGSSVSILYYANLIVPGLGDWHNYAFSLKYSPFGIYPFLIIQAIIGVEIPVEGLTNVSASIGGPFQLDYFWIMYKSGIFKLAAFILFSAFVGLGVFIFKRSGLFKSVRKYFRVVATISGVLSVIWIIVFIPKAIFLKTRFVPVNISNPGLETITETSGKILPEGWGLIDYSSQNGRPSVSLSSETSDVAEGKSSLRIILVQDSVLISLASQAFAVKPGEIVRASCLLKTKDAIPYSVRISFWRDRDPIYYSATTGIRTMDNGWKELTSQVIVPKDARKGSFLINIWGYGLPKSAEMLVDDIKIEKK
jgi:hypothetical protein